MDEYEIKFTSTTYDDYINYKDALILWYKNFTGKNPEDDGEYVGWYRIMQSYIFENLNYNQAQIFGVKEEDIRNGNWENIVFINNEDKLDESIDSNLIYLFSFSW